MWVHSPLEGAISFATEERPGGAHAPRCRVGREPGPCRRLPCRGGRSGVGGRPVRGGTLRTEYNWIPYVEDPAADGVGTVTSAWRSRNR